jgi:hypothetical protein
MTDSFTEHAELALASTRAMTKRFWGPVPLWVAGLHLVGREARVLIAITSFAGKQSNIERGPDGVIILTRAARVALGTIADHTNLARRHVQTAIRGLEAKGILRPLRRAGYATEYQIIFKRGADGTNGTDGGTGYGAPSDENGTDGGTVFGPDGAPFSGLGGTEHGALTESADSRIEPLSSRENARAHAREGGFSYNRVEEKQRVLLPIDGARERRLAALKAYNPSRGLIEWAAELRVNAFDDNVLGEFIDWHIEHDDLPGDFEATEAGYRRWIRRKRSFAKQSRHRPLQHSNATDAETAAASEFFGRMRAARANGAGNE